MSHTRSSIHAFFRAAWSTAVVLGLGCATLDAQPEGEAEALATFEEARLLALEVEALNPTDRQRTGYDTYLTRAREGLDARDFETAEAQATYALAAARRIRDRRMAMLLELEERLEQVDDLAREVKRGRPTSGLDRAALFEVVEARVALAKEAQGEGDYELALAASDEALVYLEHRDFAFGSGSPEVRMGSKRKPRRRGAPPLSCREYRLMNK